MGFKCPVCLRDFKHDKKSWAEHCKESHDGVGEDIVKFVEKITKTKSARVDEGGARGTDENTKGE